MWRMRTRADGLRLAPSRDDGGPLVSIVTATYNRSNVLAYANELLIGVYRPMLVIVPPRVSHGVQTISDEPAVILNMPDRAYEYAAPDHWRVSQESGVVPFAFPVIESTQRT
jgi:dTDP-4-dehydrorhamnose 3,5-epimerase-like enzyme